VVEPEGGTVDHRTGKGRKIGNLTTEQGMGDGKGGKEDRFQNQIRGCVRPEQKTKPREKTSVCPMEEMRRCQKEK